MREITATAISFGAMAESNCIIVNIKIAMDTMNKIGRRTTMKIAFLGIIIFSCISFSVEFDVFITKTSDMYLISKRYLNYILTDANLFVNRKNTLYFIVLCLKLINNRQKMKNSIYSVSLLLYNVACNKVSKYSTSFYLLEPEEPQQIKFPYIYHE